MKFFFAVSSILKEKRKVILCICKETGCEVKMHLACYQLVSGRITLSELPPDGRTSPNSLS